MSRLRHPPGVCVRVLDPSRAPLRAEDGRLLGHVATVQRLLLEPPEQQVGRVLLLDADVVVHGDLSTLFHWPMKRTAVLAMAPDLFGQFTFCHEAANAAREASGFLGHGARSRLQSRY